MIIVVEGTRAFDNYETFMSGMTTAFSRAKNDNEIHVWTLGPHKINNFTAAYCNSSSSYMKGVGVKVKFSKVNYEWVKQNADYIDYVAYFSLPKEPLSKFAVWADHQEDIDLLVFRF